jgi:hypothetical protein
MRFVHVLDMKYIPNTSIVRLLALQLWGCVNAVHRRSTERKRLRSTCYELRTVELGSVAWREARWGSGDASVGNRGSLLQSPSCQHLAVFDWFRANSFVPTFVGPLAKFAIFPGVAQRVNP